MSATPIPTDVFQVEDVLAAVVAMRSNDLDAKKKAQEFLQNFQKSVGTIPACDAEISS